MADLEKRGKEGGAADLVLDADPSKAKHRKKALTSRRYQE